ncbi:MULTISPECIES: TetR/AcrR family transcriptional regulator [unclassified Acidovorax]|jgi:AcrR family transcriptional regulator|uniref:TetR/AcrR family transcriptional regulator n=1 Tax=unclassified Acidovorax TaxID=2684926 RepID=UPI000BCDCBFE|nr:MULTISPECIES: TetR/AcrR family transcriptional regulator [unclassified Acidovorax]HQS19761.1 TetR/AcrR family transcriptional regulator [Acidovorax defluvii]OYY29914.1 MAG: TetR family transcriptional regulator [Acidovorax sp. 35-64-16]OYY85652.1 MAG: TetR family transcriptional regulator [Acidovorax sp. 28-64-14]OYZ45835.1 MAG: TetR family transcriptional regulator [Acidovorax sp. 16-64-162]OYZ71496.1 MAG: TetR family transcriptional regulator [Acidovorax sp. 24-64-9]
MQTPKPKVSFKEQMHLAREDAILQSTCRLLGEKSFDAMTMDDVANAVGIAKASLYKHFASKEDLCCAAMIQILGRVRAYLDTLPTDMPPQDKLRDLVRWSLERLITNEMPLLPSRNSSLRAVLMANKHYLDGLVTVSDQIGQWITEAQAQGFINPALPPLVVLYTLFARACDPVVGFLKEGGQYSDAEVVDLVVRTCFDGLAAR